MKRRAHKPPKPNRKGDIPMADSIKVHNEASGQEGRYSMPNRLHTIDTYDNLSDISVGDEVIVIVNGSYLRRQVERVIHRTD
jgi:hypothetical protein